MAAINRQHAKAPLPNFRRHQKTLSLSDSCETSTSRSSPEGPIIREVWARLQPAHPRRRVLVLSYYHETFLCLLAPPLGPGPNTTSFLCGKKTTGWALNTFNMPNTWTRHRHLFLMAHSPPATTTGSRMRHASRPCGSCNVTYNPTYDNIRPSSLYCHANSNPIAKGFHTRSSECQSQRESTKNNYLFVLHFYYQSQRLGPKNKRNGTRGACERAGKQTGKLP